MYGGSNFKGKGDIRNCCCCNRAVKLREHGMKGVEMVLEKRPCRIVAVDEMQFGFMPVRGTIDAVFILSRMQEEHHANEKKLYMLCGPRESFRQSTKESVGMGIEEERNTRSFA